MLVPLVGNDAAQLRRRRRRPDGWVPVHLGLIARTKTDGRTSWLEGEHASHWSWPEFEVACSNMRQHNARGTTVLLLLVWCPVWAGGVVEVGCPEHHDLYVRSLCWTLLPDDVPDFWAGTRALGREQALEWRHHRAGEQEQLAL